VESGNAQGFALVLHVASWAELRTVRAPSASGDHDSAVRAAGGFLAGMTHSKDRALEIHEITFDARDPHALAGFWGALLEREIRPGDMPQDDSVLVMSAPGQPGLLFLRVPEAKRAKNRVHFDLWPTSAKRDMQVERAISLGAVVLDDRRPEDGTGWVVFADPEGNEFCIGRSAAERAAGAYQMGANSVTRRRSRYSSTQCSHNDR
jgi:predicted enzyme related to lactoylglutathione lyase